MILSASNNFYASFFAFHIGINKKIKITTFVALDNGCIIYDTCIFLMKEWTKRALCDICQSL